MPPILNSDFISAGLKNGLALNLLISAFAFAISASSSLSSNTFINFLPVCCSCCLGCLRPMSLSSALSARLPSKRFASSFFVAGCAFGAFFVVALLFFFAGALCWLPIAVDASSCSCLSCCGVIRFSCNLSYKKRDVDASLFILLEVGLRFLMYSDISLRTCSKSLVSLSCSEGAVISFSASAFLPSSRACPLCWLS